MQPLRLTELVLRDGHQSLLATRLRLDDMLPIASQLDDIGYWSMESWGGATFDACIRYLGEDPWERLRKLKEVMPKTKQQMLLRGQNLLGYRHYADDVVKRFVERARINGVDVFRIFDAMNDVRNLKTAIEATIANDGHAQGTLAYTVSPVHTLDMWLEMAKALEDLGCHSICIKDMAGLLRPYDAEALILALKKVIRIPIAMQCHATTGLSTATYQKAIDAGIDMLDTSISSMSMTYGHTATETIVASVEGTERDTGLQLAAFGDIATYFRNIRHKYARFEGSLKGIDARILLAQVPGGMLTNMENQLREQKALEKFDAVLEEIPRVREDLGFIPLVTPTSQIVGTQAVLNVLTGERYKTVTKETAGILKGEYGSTAAPVNRALQQSVLGDAQPIRCRPADLIENELPKLTEELTAKAQSEAIRLAQEVVDDVLTYALFPQVGLKFLKNRDNPDAFEPPPNIETDRPVRKAEIGDNSIERYDVCISGECFSVEVGPDGSLQAQQSVLASTVRESTPAAQSSSSGHAADMHSITAPLSGNLWKYQVKPGQTIAAGDVVVILEAMKMETEVRSERSGTVVELTAREGDSVISGDVLLTLKGNK